MDAELKEYLDKKFSEIDTHFDNLEISISQIYEIETAHGQLIEAISNRLDTLELPVA